MLKKSEAYAHSVVVVGLVQTSQALLFPTNCRGCARYLIIDVAVIGAQPKTTAFSAHL